MNGLYGFPVDLGKTTISGSRIAYHSFNDILDAM
jgi:hypothetical protein